MKLRTDLTGQKFSKLTVIEFVEVVNGMPKWLCECECGNRSVVRSGNLKSGHTTSCGCVGKYILGINSRTHGMSKTPEFRAWAKMISRCYRPADPKYPIYGGRGITVCDRWRGKNGFQNFYADMGPRPSKKHSNDRIRVNGNYEPTNCRWATVQQQADNKQKTILLWHKGELKTIPQACRDAGIPYHAIKNGRTYKGFKTHQESFDFWTKPKTTLINHSFGYIT